MLTVACVNVGDYLSLGQTYVRTLRAMVDRNLKTPHEFVCIDDAEANGKTGWWAKIELFRPGRFTGRVLYLDLDSVITGPLDALAATAGAVDMHNWGIGVHAINSSVLVWDAGTHDDIFTGYTPETERRFVSDQEWMTELGGWAPLPARWCLSYRGQCTKLSKPPADCVHVSFHGTPKPHQLPAPHWVSRYWSA